MSLFWIAAGLLLVGALLFVVPPLFGSRTAKAASASQDEVNVSVYRDQLLELDLDLANATISPEQHAAARLEIEQRLLQDVDAPGQARKTRGGGGRASAVVVGLAIPVLAIALYGLLGSPQALEPAKLASSQPDPAHDITEAQFAAMVEKLAARLKESPGTAEEWTMLARSYYVMHRYSEASSAYANAAALAPDDARLLADYADALGMSQGRRLQGEPERLISRALKADPNNPKALALAGTLAFDKKEYASAIAHWQRILDQAPPESELATSIGASIAEARSLGGLDSGNAAPAAPVRSITGTVRLAPTLAGRVSPADTVFVFARSAEGPGMPLAILRKQVKDLPLAFSLDDSMSMAPNLKLSSAPQVVVGARVSKSGDATARPGDLQGLSQPVRPGASGLALVIDAEVK